MLNLRIDWMIQDMVENELARIVEDYNPLSASMIVSEPRSGIYLHLQMYQILIQIFIINQI